MDSTKLADLAITKLAGFTFHIDSPINDTMIWYDHGYLLLLVIFHERLCLLSWVAKEMRR